jgi:hypothetical protein
MRTIKAPFSSAEREAAFIDLQIEDWRRRLEALQEGDGHSVKTKNRLTGLITEGMKAAATLRACSHN